MLLKQSQCKEVQYARGMQMKDGLISHYERINEKSNEYSLLSSVLKNAKTF